MNKLPICEEHFSRKVVDQECYWCAYAIGHYDGQLYMSDKFQAEVAIGFLEPIPKADAHKLVKNYKEYMDEQTS